MTQPSRWVHGLTTFPSHAAGPGRLRLRPSNGRERAGESQVITDAGVISESQVTAGVARRRGPEPGLGRMNRFDRHGRRKW